MKLSVVYQPAVPAGTSPYRVRDEQGRELDWANVFLDGQRLRQLSPRSLRIYAYDLLDFARWFELQHRLLAEITESTLVDYVRHQLEGMRTRVMNQLQAIAMNEGMRRKKGLWSKQICRHDSRQWRSHQTNERHPPRRHGYQEWRGIQAC
jgi:hypothetical protein